MKKILFFTFLFCLIFLLGCVDERLCSNEEYATRVAEETGLITLTEESYGLLERKNYDLSGISDLNCLEELHIRRAEISDISPLQNLTNLKSLDLWKNQVSDLTPLQNLTNLKELYLADNQISDISPLQNLTNLTYLNLRSNQVSDFSLLKNLTNLDHLDFRENPVSDNGCEELKKALPYTYVEC